MWTPGYQPGGELDPPWKACHVLRTYHARIRHELDQRAHTEPRVKELLGDHNEPPLNQEDLLAMLLHVHRERVRVIERCGLAWSTDEQSVPPPVGRHRRPSGHRYPGCHGEAEHGPAGEDAGRGLGGAAASHRRGGAATARPVASAAVVATATARARTPGLRPARPSADARSARRDGPRHASADALGAAARRAQAGTARRARRTAAGRRASCHRWPRSCPGSRSSRITTPRPGTRTRSTPAWRA